MSRHVRTCPDPIKLAKGAEMLGLHPRTLLRWAAKKRLVIYRDEFTTIRFVSRAAIEALMPTAEEA